MVAALPRRHRNVPNLWCSTPHKRRGRRHERYDDRGRPGKACFPDSRDYDGWGGEVPQEAVAGKVSGVYGGATGVPGGVRSLWQRELLGPGDGGARARSAADRTAVCPTLREAA